jgi:hypothetical protein
VTHCRIATQLLTPSTGEQAFVKDASLGSPGGRQTTDAARTAAEQEEEEELCEEDKHADKVAWANVVRKGFGESHLEKAPRFAWLE